MRSKLALALLSLFLIAVHVLLWWTQPEVHVTRGTVAGNPVHTYGPTNGDARGTVVVSHGFAANKTMMRAWGFFLAGQGFRTHVLDHPGHGENRQRLIMGEAGGSNRVAANLSAVLEELIRTGGAEAGKLALVGHSMGAGAAVASAAKDDRVRATVAISGAEGLSPEQRLPANLLLMVAERDPVRIRQAAEATGSPYEVVGGRNQITIIYDREVMARSAAWIADAMQLGRPQDAAPPSVPFSWPAIWLALAASLLVFLLASAWLAPASTTFPAATTAAPHLPTTVAALAVAALSSALVGVYFRLGFLGLAVMDYVLPFFLTMALILYSFRLLWPRLFDLPARTDATLFAQVGSGLLLTLLFLGTVGVTLHLYLSHFLPGVSRISPLVLSAAGFWCYQVQEESLKQAFGSWRSLLLGLGAKAIILLVWMAALYLPNPPAFLVLVTPVSAVLFLVLEMLSFWLRRLRFGPLAIATFSSLVLAWAAAVTFPLLG